MLRVMMYRAIALGILLAVAPVRASLVMPESKTLAQLVAVSPVVVLVRPSQRAPRTATLKQRCSAQPFVRTSAAFDVIEVVRGDASLAGQTIYVDPPNWQLFRQMGEAFACKEPVPSPIVPKYASDAKPPKAGEPVILFLRPGLDGAYEETMMDGREGKGALARVRVAAKGQAQ